MRNYISLKEGVMELVVTINDKLRQEVVLYGFGNKFFKLSLNFSFLKISN